MNATPGRVADSTGNWVDGLAPGWTRPYLRLARFDRPIGAWLLLLPCWWSAGLAAVAAHAALPNLAHVALFFVGAFVMRGAGCTWNDIVDRDLDGRVERTRSRPIPSGQVSVGQAAAFLVAQALVGLLVLVQFNGFAIADRHRVARDRRGLSVHEAHHLLAADRARPGLLVGRADGLGRLVRPARSARLSALRRLDRLGDRLRHHLRAQDREDDALVGVKSTALLFGARTKPMLALFYALAVVLIGGGGISGRRRHRVLARACRVRGPSRLADPAARYRPIRTTASRCSSRTATPG